MIYELDKQCKIANVLSGNKCASDTGSFFLQQLGRMSITVEDLKNSYIDIDSYEVSGRCSVFCKSYCTHALNKGANRDKVFACLCKMMVKKITELLIDFKIKNVIMFGGISRIKAITNYIKNEVNSLYIPKQSHYIKTYGAALWALKNETKRLTNIKELFLNDKSSFSFLPPLKKFKHLVDFKNIEFSKAKNGDICILGVDVGSTTTKAVLMRKDDYAILASIYLRTEGDPIRAVKKCYKAILQQTGYVKSKIIGFGTTGSGRHIVGLHALTDSIYNEIIFHATASIYFDKDVDTIFEIGGQDAKYTYITQGIPSDYAMNEACSAGTGIFIEESAKESLNVNVEDIAEIALNAENPPNFNDQCAAFISSDIGTALQEGILKEDIIAGLVYSIFINYSNRVKGARPYDKKIFMQGGVCYNKAIPIAMAALLNTKIVVPPEPGLMWAYGCSLEIKKRLNSGLLEKKEFNLSKIITRDIQYLTPFICTGGIEKCEINLLSIEGKRIPFGGAYNKYYNIAPHIDDHSKEYNFLALRERLLFKEFAQPSDKANNNSKKIGINKTFLTYLPLYFHFWDQLGFKVVLSEESIKEGRDKKKREKIAYFTVGDVSPCRVEEYQVGMKKLVEKDRIRDVAIVNLSAEESYAGLGLKALIKTLKAFCVADVLRQIYSVIITLAENKEETLEIFNKEWENIKLNFEKKENISLYKRLAISSKNLSKIKLRKPLKYAHKIIVVGKFYVRNEEFTREYIEEKLTKMGFVTKIVPMIESLNYVDYTKWKNFAGEKISIFKRFYFLIKRKIQYYIEKKIKKIFEKSALYFSDTINIKEILKISKPLVDNRLLGEVGLTVGSALKSILNDSCGVITLSPFSCLQARTSDAILNNNMTVKKRFNLYKKSVFGKKFSEYLDPLLSLPFLSIESDGNTFPQITLAKLEVFTLQAKRLGDIMNKAKNKNDYL